MSNYIMLISMHPRFGAGLAFPCRSASVDSGVLR